MKQLFRIKNENDVQVAQPVLSIGVGETHFCFAVTDKASEDLHLLIYYRADEVDTDTLSAIYGEHIELARSYDEVQVCFDHSKNALIPAEQFHVGLSKSLLDDLHGKHGIDAVATEPIKEWQIQNIYAVPADVKDWVIRKFPKAQSRHYFTLAFKAMTTGESDRILLNIYTDDFSFIAIKNNKLVIAQTHVYSSPEDISYILLKACHQFSLSQDSVELSVTGLIEKESQLYRELYHFFVNVDLRQPTWNIPHSDRQEYPAHYFTILNDLSRCAS